MMRSTCRQCGGMRELVNVPCVLCKGSGQTTQRKTVTVPVPAGKDLNFLFCLLLLLLLLFSFLFFIFLRGGKFMSCSAA